jgi:hypothetical protein
MLDGSVSGESQSLIPNDTWDATSSGGDKFWVFTWQKTGKGLVTHLKPFHKARIPCMWVEL